MTDECEFPTVHNILAELRGLPNYGYMTERSHTRLAILVAALEHALEQGGNGETPGQTVTQATDKAQYTV